MTHRSNRIRTLRQAAGLTQEALGDQVGVGQSAIARYERGRRLPDLPTAVALSLALQQPFEEVFPGALQEAARR